MFDFVRDSKRVVQIILGVIAVTFAFFGIDAYFRQSDSAGGAVAHVGDQRISQIDFGEALRRQQEQVRSMLGNQVDAATLDSPEIRAVVLDHLIRQRMLLEDAARDGLVVPDSELQKLLTGIPEFQSDGKFSMAKYEQFLQARRRNAATFENELRGDLMVQRLSDGYASTAIVPASVVERLARIRDQKREISVSVINAEQFVDQVKLDVDAAKKYYETHPSEFQIPEQARMQFIVLSPDTLASRVAVSDEEARSFYQQNASRYQKGEERKASHILINAPHDASADVKAAAKAKADALLKQVREKPESFAAVAKANSQDTGSASKGGDLGFFARGSMVQPFEDAGFKLKVGEITGPVQSEFGYHVIKLTGLKPAQTTDFVQAKPQIEQELRRQKAEKLFADAAETFTNLVYEQPDSLKPAADQLKLQVQESPWIARGAADVPAPLNNPRLLAAIFSDDVLKNKRNTEAIEVGSNRLVAARLIEHRPAAMKPFDTVSADIRKRLLMQEAQRLAVKEGQARLAKLRAGAAVNASWTAPKLMTREKAEGLAPAAVQQVFRADVTKLPAYTGVDYGRNGYALLKVTRVVEPSEVPQPQRKELATALAQVAGQEDLSAYVASLRNSVEVKVDQSLLQQKQ